MYNEEYTVRSAIATLVEFNVTSRVQHTLTDSLGTIMFNLDFEHGGMSELVQAIYTKVEDHD